MKDKKTRPNIIEAFNAAIQGIIYTFKYERNMKIHYLIAVAVLIVSLRFNLNKLEMMILILSISSRLLLKIFRFAVSHNEVILLNRNPAEIKPRNDAWGKRVSKLAFVFSLKEENSLKAASKVSSMLRDL